MSFLSWWERISKYGKFAATEMDLHCRNMYTLMIDRLAGDPVEDEEGLSSAHLVFKQISLKCQLRIHMCNNKVANKQTTPHTTK